MVLAVGESAEGILVFSRVHFGRICVVLIRRNVRSSTEHVDQPQVSDFELANEEVVAIRPVGHRRMGGRERIPSSVGL